MEIIVAPDPDKTYKVTLDGKSYNLRIKYLQRLTNEATGNPIKADEFTISISLAGGEPFITTSLKTNRNILKMYRARENCPKGILMLRDYTADFNFANTGEGYTPERVSYSELGTRFILIYTPPPSS
ncbi:hypothetical protein NVP1084O_169 [Vibrio phage 1.084.O._10N.261.49.F5]|nr:hypothetical protein NVP1084O_169 [Vibrio phage 1.084.O._10N.261.49.F5]